MFVLLFYAKRSPNLTVKTVLLQTTSTKSTSREKGDNAEQQVKSITYCRIMIKMTRRNVALYL